MGKFHKGKFRPKNPVKYVGDPSNIIYRSSWELSLMMYLDKHKDVLKWGSEELVIPYTDPTDPSRRFRRYYPDFVVQKRGADGEVEVIVIEVKPFKETQEPTPGKNKKRYLYELATYGRNQAKWAAAKRYCKKHGMKFQIMTERNLGVS